MPLLAWILIFTALGGLLSALAASLFLVAPATVRTRALPHLVSFATGALLSAALLGLLPHAIEGAGAGNTHEVGMALLIGLLLFFVLEKLVLWRHCHHDACEGDVPHAHQLVHEPAHRSAHPPEHQVAPQLAHRLAHPGAHETPHRTVHQAAHQHANGRDAASAALILIGDGFHNVLDGMLIAAAFLTDKHLGVVTALAVFAHEIPQEVGDLAILLHGGMSRRRALMLNLLTSITSVVGGLLAYKTTTRFLV